MDFSKKVKKTESKRVDAVMDGWIERG